MAMTTEERSNKALVSALTDSTSQPCLPVNQVLISKISVYNVQPSSTTLVVRPNAPAAAMSAGDPSIQATFTNVVQAYSATNVKLHSILKT